MDTSALTQKIKKTAIQLGFDAVGITKAELLEEDRAYLDSWLSAGYAGSMNYMHNYFEKRVDVSKLIDGAKSVIVLLYNYMPEKLQSASAPKVAKYAYGNDYHHIIKQKLEQVVSQIPEIKLDEQQCFCDSAPLLEKRLAVRAGLGWIGKNTTLINKRFGSYCFISEIVTDKELVYDKPDLSTHCGNCKRCIDECATNALYKEYQMDARKCLSYITVESKDDRSQDEALRSTHTLFGCDKCQSVCPWNLRFAHSSNHEELKALDFLNWTNEDWVNLDKSKFNRIFRNSAMQRAGYEKIMTILNCLM